MSIIYGAYSFIKKNEDSPLEITYRSSVFLSITLYFNIMSILGFAYKLNWFEFPLWSYVASHLWIVVLFAIVLLLIVMRILAFFNLIDKAILWKENN